MCITNAESSKQEEMKIMPPFLCPLEQLASRRLENEGQLLILDVPAFQRGLVWNSAQVEVLWDSIMRGIPIGSVTLIRYAERSQLKRESKATHGIFDGQQRSNAIRLGIDNPFSIDQSEKESPSSILWLDLLPSKGKSKSPSREFYFYLTTAGQPWGYKINDSGGETRNALLSTSERGGNQDKICYQKPSILDEWPYMAGLPIPFSILWKITGTINLEHIEEELEKYASYPWYAHYQMIKVELNDEQKADLEQQIKKIAKGLQLAHMAKVVVVVAPDTFDLSQESPPDDAQSIDTEKNSDVAVFFTRLNRGGTTPSQEDMNYSILKSIAPSLVSIDGIAEGMMKAARLATIAMRLYMTERSKEKQWKGDVSRKDVYSLANDKNFSEFVANTLTARVQKLDNLLWYNSSGCEWGMPRIVLSSLIHNNPNLYLFLLILADKATDNDSRALVAAAMLVGLFAINISYKDSYAIISEGCESVEMSIRNWLYHCIVNVQLHLPPPPSIYEELTQATSTGDKDKVDYAWNPPLYKHALEKVWHWTHPGSRALLLYTFREYIETKFQGYTPALAAWQEDNRPWDYDHIFPQSWVIHGKGRAHGDYHWLVGEFVNCIGNIAPIAYSVNRSKNDAAPFTRGYYLGEEEDSSLFCVLDEEDKSIPFLKDSPKSAIEHDKNNSFKLGRWIAKRMEKIYKEFYHSLHLEEFLEFSRHDHARQMLFIRFREEFSKLLPENRREELNACYSITYTGAQKEIGFGTSEFSFPWLSCGLKVQLPGKDAPRALLCVCSNGTIVEWGLRRHPEDTSVAGDTRIWWVPKRLLSKELADQLDKLNDSDYLCRTKEMKDCQVEEIVNMLMTAYNTLK